VPHDKARGELRAGLLVAVASLIACVLAGCVPLQTSPADESEFVGTWTNGTTTLELKADQTFTLTDAPEYTLFTWEGDWRSSTALRDASGTWSAGTDSIHIQNVDEGAGEKLEVWGPGLIGFGVGDLDDPRCFELVRDGSLITPRGPDECYSYG
jgi:hypothetical protein